MPSCTIVPRVTATSTADAPHAPPVVAMSMPWSGLQVPGPSATDNGWIGNAHPPTAPRLPGRWLKAWALLPRGTEIPWWRSRASSERISASEGAPRATCRLLVAACLGRGSGWSPIFPDTERALEVCPDWAAPEDEGWPAGPEAGAGAAGPPPAVAPGAPGVAASGAVTFTGPRASEESRQNSIAPTTSSRCTQGTY